MPIKSEISGCALLQLRKEVNTPFFARGGSNLKLNRRPGSFRILSPTTFPLSNNGTAHTGAAYKRVEEIVSCEALNFMLGRTVFRQCREKYDGDQVSDVDAIINAAPT